MLVLWLKELSDYIKYSSEAECMRLLRRNMGRTSGMACLMQGRKSVLVPVRDLREGETIEIHPGEVVPVNGEVLKGKAFVNSLYHTGQPLVSVVTDGHQVFEGMAVLSGDLTVKVTGLPETYGKTDLSAGDLRLSRNNRRYARNITYAALGLAVVYYVIRRSFLGSLAIMLALSPSASAAGFSSGMKNYVSLLNKPRVYIRNPNVFEKIVNVDHVVFDKTGTLTYGTMRIRGIEVLNPAYSESELLKICAACEVNSYHPISVTLQKVGDGYDIRKVQSSVLLPSKGICAKYDRRDVLIGNRELMQEADIDISGGLAGYETAEKNLCTPVFVAIDHALSGIIVLEDVLRDNAKELVDRLKRIGIRNITLLTGDGAEKARRAASALGIGNVRSNCSAEDKVAVVRRLKENERVMMIGDGVNDVLSMREADISISYVDSACDKVKLHSDCIIFEEDLAKLPDLILLSRKSYRSIRQSIFATNAYNLFFGFLAFSERIDAFAAKSFNTINSLMVLLLNQRILYLSPGRIPREEQHPAPEEQFGPAGSQPLRAPPERCGR